MAVSLMNMTLDIPDELLGELSAEFDDLGRTALEALAARAYEKDALSLEQVRQLLDLPSRWEAEEVLKQHGVWPGATVEDFRSDMDTMERLRASMS